MPIWRSQRKDPTRSSIFTKKIAAIVAIPVAMRVEPTMAVGFLLPLIARILIAVAGNNLMELVLSAKKVHIALVATPFLWFRSFRCAIAFKPSGVAALLTPSMFAAIFIIIAP